MLTIRINVHSLSRQSNTFNHLKFQIPSFHLACLADRAGQGRAAVREFQRSGAIIFIFFIFFITFITFFTIILSCTGHAPEQWRAHTQRLMLQWSGWLGAPGPAIARLPRLRGALINIFLVWPRAWCLVPAGAGAWCLESANMCQLQFRPLSTLFCLQLITSAHYLGAVKDNH